MTIYNLYGRLISLNSLCVFIYGKVTKQLSDNAPIQAPPQATVVKKGQSMAKRSKKVNKIQSSMGSASGGAATTTSTTTAYEKATCYDIELKRQANERRMLL